MATIANRLTSTGTLLVNGIIDEVTQSTIRANTNTVLSATFDEVSGMSSSNGLIFYVDPGKTASYVGTGTRINDIQTVTTIGTPQNSLTYTSTTPGYFTYNGTNQYINFGNVPLAEVQDKTAMAWIYITSTVSSVRGIIDKDYETSASIYGGWGFWVGPITGGAGLWFWAQGGKDLKDTTVLSLNTWYHVAVVWNYTSKSATFYVNGVAKSTQTDATIVEKTSNNTTLKIGTIRNAASAFFTGRIGAAQVYNRQLTASEILNNYNADAARYGYSPTTTVPVRRDNSAGILSVIDSFDEFTGAPVIDSSLVLWLDPGQTSSYSGSGNNWADLSSVSSNATLVNSPSFISTTGGGTFTLNGSTQYATLGTPTKLTSLTTTFTISAWVNFSSFPSSGNWSEIYTTGYAGAGTQTDFRITGGSPGSLTLMTYQETPTTITRQVTYSVSNLSTSTWYNICGVWNNSSAYLYVNGSLVSSATPGAIFPGSVALSIGAFSLNGSYQRFLNGNIGQMAIYNRVLAADEINTNFNALRGRFGI